MFFFHSLLHKRKIFEAFCALWSVDYKEVDRNSLAKEKTLPLVRVNMSLCLNNKLLQCTFQHHVHQFDCWNIYVSRISVNVVAPGQCLQASTLLLRPTQWKRNCTLKAKNYKKLKTNVTRWVCTACFGFHSLFFFSSQTFVNKAFSFNVI